MVTGTVELPSRVDEHDLVAVGGDDAALGQALLVERAVEPGVPVGGVVLDVETRLALEALSLFEAGVAGRFRAAGAGREHRECCGSHDCWLHGSECAVGSEGLLNPSQATGSRHRLRAWCV